MNDILKQNYQEGINLSATIHKCIWVLSLGVVATITIDIEAVYAISKKTNNAATSIMAIAERDKSTAEKNQLENLVLHAQTNINEVPRALSPAAKAVSDRYEALGRGYPFPGTDQTDLLMHGYVPPGMTSQHAQMFYNALPNDLRKPFNPHPGSMKWIEKVAPEPMHSSKTSLQSASMFRNEIDVSNEILMRESVRQRFGPIYIPPLQKNYNQQPISKSIQKGLTFQHFYVEDHLGSIREMTDSNGSIVAQYAYDPYGQQTKFSDTVIDADFDFEGYYKHQRSGLNLTLTRAYNSSLGKFLNRDLINEAGGINLYAYAGNDPRNRFDPSGQQPITYGNWGGQGWVNGGPGSETSNFPNIGHPNFKKPTTPRDRCYYWHDVCLHNCATIGSSNPKDPRQTQYACDRQRCRKNCDTDLARCLHNVINTYGDQGFPPTMQREIGGFSGNDPFPGFSGAPNDNPGAFVPGLQPYNPNADPGFGI